MSTATTFDPASTRSCGEQIIAELSAVRDRQPTDTGVQVVDALTGVAQQIAACGCECCSTNVATIVALVDLEG